MCLVRAHGHLPTCAPYLDAHQLLCCCVLWRVDRLACLRPICCANSAAAAPDRMVWVVRSMTYRAALVASLMPRMSQTAPASWVSCECMWGFTMCHRPASAFKAAHGLAKDRVLQGTGCCRQPRVLQRGPAFMEVCMCTAFCWHCAVQVVADRPAPLRRPRRLQATPTCMVNTQCAASSWACPRAGLHCPGCKVAGWAAVLYMHVMCRDARGPYRYVKGVHCSVIELTGEVGHLLKPSGFTRRQRRHVAPVQGIQPCSTLPQS